MERSPRFASFLENPCSGPHPGLPGGLLLRPSHSFICSFILRSIQQPLRGYLLGVGHAAERCESPPNARWGDSLLTRKNPMAGQAVPPIFWNCAKMTRVHPRKNTGAGQGLPRDSVPLSPPSFKTWKLRYGERRWSTQGLAPVASGRLGLAGLY